MAIDTGTVRDGALRADTVNSSGIPIDMESRTKVLMPAKYTTKTLVKMFSKGAWIESNDMQHKYRERRPIPMFTTISVADAAAQTTVEVADYTYIKNDQILWVMRNGNVLMQLLVQDTSIDATVTIVNFNGTTGSGGLPVATEVGDVVVIGPEAHAEGEAVPEAFTNISVNVTDNLMQTDRAVKKTDIESSIAHYDDREKSLATDMAVAWVEVMAKMNLKMYLGQKTLESTSASVRRYAFNGLFQRLTENVENYGGVGSGFTVQALQEILRECIDESPVGGSKVLIAGVNINNHISSWPDGSIKVSPNDTKWGIKIRTINTQYGPIEVVYDNVLNESYGLSDRGVILDSGNIKQMRLRGKGIKGYMDITNRRDIHNMENAISGTYGIQASSVESFAQIKGVN